jgi:peptidyl-prolyl cis-trans isomerase C
MTMHSRLLFALLSGTIAATPVAAQTADAPAAAKAAEAPAADKPADAPAAPAKAAAAPKAASTAGRIATVNGVVIPKSRADAMIKDRTQQGMPDSEDLRKAVREQLISTELIVQDANRKGIAKSAEVQSQIDLARQQVIVRAYLQNFLKTHPVGDDVVKAEYEKIRGQMGDKEYKVRHILVEKEADAKDIVAKLKKGEKFEDLAKVSKDPGSKDRGGDLDWNTPTSYVKPFADAMTKLEKGKYTETPVQTQFGWHVIQLDDVRPMKFPGLDEVKPGLQQRLQQQMLEKSLADMRAKAKID